MKKGNKIKDKATGSSCGEENENRVCSFQFDTYFQMKTSTRKTVNYRAGGYDMKWNQKTWNYTLSLQNIFVMLS